MIDFYELNESEVLSSKSIPAGALICCKDSTNIYMIPTNGGSAVKMAETTRFLTEAARKAILAPINGKKYFCYDIGKMWIYYNDWICINPEITSEFDIEDVTLPTTGSIVVSDTRIKSTNTGTFIPDASMSDLAASITVACADGKATITGTTSYPVSGVLKIK